MQRLQLAPGPNCSEGAAPGVTAPICPGAFVAAAAPGLKAAAFAPAPLSAAFPAGTVVLSTPWMLAVK